MTDILFKNSNIGIASWQNWLIIDNKKTTFRSPRNFKYFAVIFYGYYLLIEIVYKYIFDDNKPGCEVLLDRFQYNKVDKNKFELYFRRFSNC